jgi:TPR repeat protein
MKGFSSILLLCALLAVTPRTVALGEQTPPTMRQALGPALNGNINAQFSLGFAYEKGLGGKKDFKQAVRWYEKAANQGHAEAQYRLAAILEEGRPQVKADVANALSWYEESARNGFKSAKQRLAVMTSAQSASGY